MPFVPLPFVVAVLLIALFGAAMRNGGEGPPNRPFLACILLAAVLSVLTGLRWGYGVTSIIPYLAPVCAAAGPPLAYAGVKNLVHRNRGPVAQRLALHGMPALFIIILLATWRVAVDVALVLIFAAYAVAILLMMRRGTDALRLASFEEAEPAFRAILFAAIALLFSASIDAFIFVDMTWMDGAHSPPVIAIGNLAGLMILSAAAAAASRSRPAMEVTAAPLCETAGEKETLSAVAALMTTRRVYRDADLTLDRLARKLGMPARQISTAVNRITGRNVSQYVNEYRITEACALLDETDRTVTEIMFEVGFQTKSNFNREFRRVTDMSPLEWRGRTASPTRIAIEHDL